jgi:hypothetical protein
VVVKLPAFFALNGRTLTKDFVLVLKTIKVILKETGK